MNKFYLFLTILFFSFSILKAETVNKIIIDGNKRVSIETIKLYGEIEINKDYKEKDLNLILKNLYETNFFEDVKISLKNNTLNINLKEYPIINQLIITGEKSKKYKDLIKKGIDTKEKGSLIKSRLAKDIELIESLYSSLGYNMVKAEAKLRKIDEANFDLPIEVMNSTILKRYDEALKTETLKRVERTRREHALIRKQVEDSNADTPRTEDANIRRERLNNWLEKRDAEAAKEREKFAKRKSEVDK